VTANLSRNAEVVRNAIKETDEIKKSNILTDDVKRMIKIVEDFIIRKKLICYGGTAINNILPERDQFYNKEEIPITIFFPVTLDDAKELADIYHKAGFKSIEAKSGCTSELSRSSLTIFPSPISHRSVLKYTRLFWTTPCLLKSTTVLPTTFA
jgi:hypothetical protein